MNGAQYSGMAKTLSDLTRHHWAAHPQLNACILLDGACHPERLNAFRTHWPERSCISLYADLPEGASVHCTPLLFGLDASWMASEAFGAWLWDAEDLVPGRMCLIWSDMDQQSMARHLKQHVHVVTPEGKTALLRFQDPDVLPHALDCMAPAQRQHFLEPIQSLCWTDLDQRWVKLPGGGQPSSPKHEETWQWTQAQLQQLDRALAPRKILDHLQQEHAEWLSGSQEGWCLRLRDWVQQAQAQGIADVVAWRVYCTAALTVGDDFMQAPEVISVLKEGGRPMSSDVFLQAMKAVPDAAWDRLAARKLAVREASYPRSTP